MDEEITKEIKTISELEEKESLEDDVLASTEEPKEEVTEEQTTEEPTEEKKEETPVEEKPEEPVIVKEIKPKKKLFIIIGCVALAIILLIVLIVVLTHKGDKKENKEKKTNESPFVTTMKESLKDGSFDKEIKNGLKENDINTDTVCIINMDIDSDLEQEVVVYAEEGAKKVILQLEVDEVVSLDDSFLVDAKDSLGYVYSSINKENYWYTEYTKNYTIISSAKKIIKEEDFLNEYFALTKTYKEKPILNHCVEYKFDADLDAKKLEKSAITNEEVLEDNNIKEDEIADAYAKYIKEKQEKEAKEKAEAEQKEKEEEEKRKLSGTLKLGTIDYKYGKYTLKTPEGEDDGVMMLYSDLTCVFKGVACTFNVGEVRGAEGDLVPGIALSGGQTFTTTEDTGVLVDPEKGTLASYAG